MKNYILVLFLLLTNLVYSQAPTVSQISPTSATGNVVVTIVGTNFTGTTSVVLRSDVSISVPFSVPNPTTILAYVNVSRDNYRGANGQFIVTNASGSNTSSATFTYTPLATTCNSIVYGPWKSCSNGIQKRSYTVTPTSRPCVANPPLDSIQRPCTSATVRHFKYDPNDNTIGIISDMAGVVSVRNPTTKALVGTLSYSKGPNTLDFSPFPSGDYVATTADKSINISTKFQLVIESSDVNNIVVKGKYGTPPYQYALVNRSTSYENSLNYVIPRNIHAVRCKDATGKVVALSIQNTYSDNCTLKTTSNNYNRGLGGVVDTTGQSEVPLVVSNEYMDELLAQTTNTQRNSSRGSTRDAIPPSVSITSPHNNDTVLGSVPIVCTATDNVGIASVTAYLDGAQIYNTAQVSGSTYTIPWSTTGVATGLHVIKVIAKDAAKNSATSSIQVIVGSGAILSDVTPPSVAFSGVWVNGYTITIGTNYTLTATASDNVGVTSVGFFYDSTNSIGIDNTSPYSTTWNTTGLSAGTHSLRVRAFDANGNQTSSTIIINATTSSSGSGGGSGDVTKPTVSFTGKWVNGIIRDMSEIDTVTATASDNVAVTCVRFYVDSVEMGANVGPIPFYFYQDSTAPYVAVFYWNKGLSLGNHRLIARAFDAAGNYKDTSIIFNLKATFAFQPINNCDTSNSNKWIISTNLKDTVIYVGGTASTTVNIRSTNLQNPPITRVRFWVGQSWNFSLPPTCIDSTYPYTCSFTSTGINVLPGQYIAYRVYIIVDAPQSCGTNALYGNSNYVSMRTIWIANPLTYTPGGLPSVFNLSTPPVGNQGSEGSCVAWGVGYSAFSTSWYYRNAQTSYSYSTNIFSPEWLYNWGVRIGCSSPCSCGSGMFYGPGTFDFIRDSGLCRWSTLPYTSGSCTWAPTSGQISEALQYRSNYVKALNTDSINIKNVLFYGKTSVPVAITKIGSGFYNAGPGFIWRTVGTLVSGVHCVTIVGWDDTKHAYKVMNSWGTGWGDAGYSYIDYDLLPQVTSTYNFFFSN